MRNKIATVVNLLLKIKFIAYKMVKFGGDLYLNCCRGFGDELNLLRWERDVLELFRGNHNVC